MGELGFLVGVIFNRMGKVEILRLARTHPPPLFAPLMGHPDLPVRKILMRVLYVLTVKILKRVSESIFFQSNKFRARLKMKKRLQIL